MAVVAGMLLALPSAASAKTFTVNDTDDFSDDSPGDGICAIAGGGCTLRAAIEEANITGAKDTIKFSGAVKGSTISPASTLEIDTPMEIKAGDCGDNLISHRPCVGIDGPGPGNVFFLDTLADNSLIKGLAIFGQQPGRAILVDAGASGFRLTNSWLGFELDVDLNRNASDIDIEGDGATIGGKTGAERNVLAGGSASNSHALHIDGGDGNKVRGNYFGVEPDGTTGAAPGGNLVELSNGDDGDPVENVIGASISSAGRATAKCDKGCNVIADSATNGIRVQEGVDTTIKGNFIGLDASGAARENDLRGIDVSGSGVDDTTIGGATSAERNFITGGNTGIRIGQNSGTPAVKRNIIGLNSAGTQLADPPTFAGIDTGSVAGDGVLVARNRIAGDSDFGLIVGGTSFTAFDARVVRNKVGLDKNGNDEEGPNLGFWITAGNSTIGEPGAGNTIGNTDVVAISIEGVNDTFAPGDGNVVRGNRIGVDSAGVSHPNAGVGIQLFGNADPVDDNVIGGNSGASENVVSNSGGDAIQIVDDSFASTGNQVKRNRGKNNGTVNFDDLFIDLGDNGFGNPGVNNGIDSPVLANASPGDTTRTHTEGTCEGDTVYIFRTSNAGGDEPNRINAFVKMVACVGGAFSTNFSKIPSGQSLTALNLDNVDGSSELAEAVALPAAASAKTFTVNDTGDAGDANLGDGICATASAVCTLRAATDQADANPATNDTIKFSKNVFTGNESTSTIDIVGPGPPSNLDLGSEMTINGGDCPGGGLSHRPCVGVHMTLAGNSPLELHAPGIDIRGLAVTGASLGAAGIGAGMEADALTVRNSWLGLKLDGTPAGNDFGLRLRGEGGVIGGKTGAERNVFAANGVGLQIEQAHNSKVRGNYFGVKADGVTADDDTKNEDDTISISSTATGTVVGATISSSGMATSKCDKGCNVIANGGDAGGEAAIRTAGEGTRIKGNFIGLDRTGNVELGNTNVNIDVLGNGTTVGGDTGADRNFIAGGAGNDFGLLMNPVEDLVVKRNYVGLNSAGTAMLDNPNGSNLSILSTANGPTTVARNRLAAFGGAGIVVGGTRARVVRNKIGVDKNGSSLGTNTGGSIGINVTGTDARIGEPGAGNTVGNAFGAGIRIENGDDNVVQGNYVGRNAEGASLPTTAGPGVHLLRTAGTVDSNLIGGDTSAAENVISNSAGDAIALADATGASAGNQFVRNRGKNNGTVNADDMFIDLGNDGPGNPTGVNGGISQPTLANADPGDTTRKHTEGICEPNATVYIFRTSNAHGAYPNRINAFVKKTSCNIAGEFSANFPKIPSGQQLTALNLDATDGSSELALAVAPPGP